MAARSISEAALQFLTELIAIPSTRGNEDPAARYVQAAFAPLVDRADLIEISDSIMDDPDYAFPLPGFTYKDTHNVECIIHGDDRNRALVFNAHLDVVPPSEGQKDPFQARFQDGLVYGRGACDDKGQIAVLYSLALALKERGIRPPCDLIFHFVVEEENGGNGTLAMIQRGVKAEAAIVLEASEFAIIPAVRGAVWFTLEVYGRAAHSGNTQDRISAIDKAIQAIEIFRRYHDRLLKESRHLPLFDQHEDPMPLTIGQFNAGVWPASVPNKAVLRGLLGFLPNVDRKQVQAGLREALKKEGDQWLCENHRLEFNMLNNDGNQIPSDHPLVTTLAGAVQRSGLSGEIRAMTAACDAWQYNNFLKIPTVVFGPGSLRHAHSKDEQIRLADILLAAEILIDFTQSYCQSVPPPNTFAQEED